MTDKPRKQRRRWPAFLLGAATVALIVCAVALYREYDSIGKPQILKDGAAHVRCLERGVPVPSSAKDSYYFYVEGFVNYREYFSFSAGAADVRAVARACAERVAANPTFKAGTKSEQWFVTNGPGHDHSRYDTTLWDLSAVKNGEMFEKGQLFVLIDTDKNRVFIATWGNFNQIEKLPLGVPRLSSGMAWYLYDQLKDKQMRTKDSTVPSEGASSNAFKF